MKNRLFKNFKPLYSLCLCTVFLFCIGAVGSTAVGRSFEVSAVCENGMPGDTVSVYVQIKNASLGSVTVNLNYNPGELEFVSAQVREAGAALPYTSANRVGETAQIRFSGLTNGNDDVLLDGSLMEVKFKLLAISGTAQVTLSGVAYSAGLEKLNPLMQNGGILVNNTNIVSVPVGTPADSADALIARYKNSSNTVVVKSNSGMALTGNQIAGTGAVVVINGITEIPIVVMADLSGDGLIDLFDYTLLKYAAVGAVTLTESTRAAADLNGDGAVDAFDTACLDLILYA